MSSMARFAAVALFVAVLVADRGAPAPPDLLVVSSQAVEHSALLAQPGSRFPVAASDLKQVSEVVLKVLNVDGMGGPVFGRRLPRALLTVIVGGLASEMVNSIDFPNLSALLSSAPKSIISRIPEPRSFDNMLNTAFTTKDVSLNAHIQSALQHQAKVSTLSSSELVCRLFLGCEPVSGNIQDVVSAVNGKLQNDMLLFSGSNGRECQLDTTDNAVGAFLNEVAMVLSGSFSSSDSIAPSLFTIAFSTLDAILYEHGIQSAVASSCFTVLDLAIPEIVGKFQGAFNDRAEMILLLLPPSHDAYITQEIRKILASVNAAGSALSAFVTLDDRTSNGIAVARKRLSESLPANFKILSLEGDSKNTMDANPALYQITLWVSVLLVIMVIISTGALCCGESRKDTLLYSKINPSTDKKHR